MPQLSLVTPRQPGPEPELEPEPETEPEPAPAPAPALPEAGKLAANQLYMPDTEDLLRKFDEVDLNRNGSLDWPEVLLAGRTLFPGSHISEAAMRNAYVQMYTCRRLIDLSLMLSAFVLHAGD